MHSVWRRPAQLRRTSSPGLCHGVAGLLQIVLRFYNDTGDEEFARFARELVDELLGRFEPESAFGYRVFERDDDADSPGFLEGAAGVAAVLTAAATATAPAWDQMLLIS
jgi:lantibiotic modifying enzyme